MKTITRHYIDRAFVESHGHEVMDIINPMVTQKQYERVQSYVSGANVQRARRVASQILAGRVAINGMLDDQQAPFGGFKHSGVGREFGTYGIEAFLEPRAILE
jgi:glycerol kinase